MRLMQKAVRYFINNIKLTVIIFSLALLSLKATAQMIESDIDNNDNWRYFNDISVEIGSYVPISAAEHSFGDGTIISFSRSYYWNDKFGLRAGVSFIRANALKSYSFDNNCFKKIKIV